MSRCKGVFNKVDSVCRATITSLFLYKIQENKKQSTFMGFFVELHFLLFWKQLLEKKWVMPCNVTVISCSVFVTMQFAITLSSFNEQKGLTTGPPLRWYDLSEGSFSAQSHCISDATGVISWPLKCISISYIEQTKHKLYINKLDVYTYSLKLYTTFKMPWWYGWWCR